MEITDQKTPNIEELKNFFETTFACIIEEDGKEFTDETSQSLDEWFDISVLPAMLPFGSLLEVRDELGKLLAAAFVGKQHPLSWPDGRKAEIFIMAVHPETRGKGIGTQLLARVEESARTMGARKIVVNTNTLMRKTKAFYEKSGYKELGILTKYYDNGDAVFLGKDL